MCNVVSLVILYVPVGILTRIFIEPYWLTHGKFKFVREQEYNINHFNNVATINEKF